MLTDLTMNELLNPQGVCCSCGKKHYTELREVYCECGALSKVPEVLRAHNWLKPHIVCDVNTYAAAGEKLCGLLREAGIAYTIYRFPQKAVTPDEFSVGQVIMEMPHCDVVLAVGSGTINDICKIAARTAGVPMVDIATAPSMDGFASNTSSMLSAGIKKSIASLCPEVIIADIDVLANAPMLMLQSGLGDMLAKFISICEWQISHLINNEYYCPEIADLVKKSLNECISGAKGIPTRDPAAIEAITRGLILSGIAMSYATISRPASGLEHYISHMWDMSAINDHTAESLHGIQCGIATLMTLKLYEWVKEIETVNVEKGLKHAKAHDVEAWKAACRRRFGSGADVIIALEQKEGKYDAQKHAKRLAFIAEHWDELKVFMNELPSYEEVADLLKQIGAPMKPADIGITADGAREAVLGSGDIRDKYVLSRLLWDLGLLEEYAEKISR